MILGKIIVETPKYEEIATANGYEIRKCPPSVAVEVTYELVQFKSNKDGGVMILDSYIGALENPQNSKLEKSAITTLVITKTTSEKIAMTAPVVTKSDGELVTMGFILPSRYVRAVEAPRPPDKRVVIREEGKRKYDVTRDEVAAKKAEVVHNDLVLCIN